MEGEPAPRKRRFIPKTAPRRVPKLEVKMYASLMVKTDHVTEESDAEKARDWLKRLLVPTQTAFGGAASTSMKVYGAPKCGNTDAAASGMKVEKEYGCLGIAFYVKGSTFKRWMTTWLESFHFCIASDQIGFICCQGLP
ncbi:hypothetical protein EV1_017843 [Malus domestica]